MSHSGKTIQQEMGFDSLPDRFHDSLNFDTNKPDFKELDLGSPVSPLVSRKSTTNHSGGHGGAVTTTTNTSCSSTSSSGSVSSGKANNTQLVKGQDRNPKSHSGELSGSTVTSPCAAESLRSVATTCNLKPGHRRSVSAGPPLIYAGSSFNAGNHGATSSSSSPSPNPNPNLLPNGNICPSGKIMKSSLATRNTTRTDVLGSGTGKYGHGSIMRGNAKSGNVVDPNLTGNIHSAGETAMSKKAVPSSNPEDLKKAGNELYKRGNFVEALNLYNRAISILPDNPAYRSNRAAALTALGRLEEAVKECEEAVRLDPGYGRAHQRLASLYLRLGQVENARCHLCISGQQPDQAELQKLRCLEKHLNRCGDARKIGDWKSALRECNAAISAGADSCPQLIACKAEALLKLHQLEDADSTLSNVPKSEPHTTSTSQTNFFGMFAEAYMLYVRAHMEMALGRFENAVFMAEKAGLIDYSNVEIAKLLSNVKMVARARARGNDLFSSGRFEEACSAYGEGLKYDTFNSVLYCNRAVCWSKMGLWEQSVEDCNQALKIQPNYTKALLRRAVSNVKLERWAEAVRDYEVLRRQLPGDNEVADSLFHAQVALNKSRGEEVNNMKFGCEVEEVTNFGQFKTAISSPGLSVVHFRMTSNQQCEQISPFINTLCLRYPSVNFLKVDVDDNPLVARAEGIRSVPTFKIYKNGSTVKEMICPSHQVLESAVKHYIL